MDAVELTRGNQACQQNGAKLITPKQKFSLNFVVVVGSETVLRRIDLCWLEITSKTSTLIIAHIPFVRCIRTLLGQLNNRLVSGHNSGLYFPRFRM